MKVFISQPMKGKTVGEIKKERKKAYREACLLTGETLLLLASRPTDTTLDVVRAYDTPLKCLAYSLFKMADADVAYFAEGWENARGCRIEHECARQYGIRIIEYTDGLAQ